MIYIPEDIDIETIYNEIHDMDIHQLRKRARYLGTSEKIMKLKSKLNVKDEKRELKEKIISLSKREEDIQFKKLDEEIIEKEAKRRILRKDGKVKVSKSQQNMQDPEFKAIHDSIHNSPLYS